MKCWMVAEIIDDLRSQEVLGQWHSIRQFDDNLMLPKNVFIRGSDPCFFPNFLKHHYHNYSHCFLNNNSIIFIYFQIASCQIFNFSFTDTFERVLFTFEIPGNWDRAKSIGHFVKANIVQISWWLTLFS